MAENDAELIPCPGGCNCFVPRVIVEAVIARREERLRADLAAPASDLWSDLELVVECIDIPLPQKDSIVAAIRRTQVKFADAIRQARRDIWEAAIDIVKQSLDGDDAIARMQGNAAALRAEGEKGEGNG